MEAYKGVTAEGRKSNNPWKRQSPKASGLLEGEASIAGRILLEAGLRTPGKATAVLPEASAITEHGQPGYRVYTLFLSLTSDISPRRRGARLPAFSSQFLSILHKLENPIFFIWMFWKGWLLKLPFLSNVPLNNRAHTLSAGYFSEGEV